MRFIPAVSREYWFIAARLEEISSYTGRFAKRFEDLDDTQVLAEAKKIEGQIAQTTARLQCARASIESSINSR